MAYSKGEEIASAIIHGIGALLGVAALAILVTMASIKGDVWAIVATAIFGTSMIVLYTASTLYHAITSESAKKKLKKFDHISIYYLIAGTYTPFLLVNLRGALGWSIFGVIWGLAITGTLLKIFTTTNGKKAWSIGLYALMGWLIIVASEALFSTLPAKGLLFLILGGVFYTLGILFYVWKSKKYTHAIWHFFVLAGTIMHFFAILYSSVL
ncbi:MAG: hemolysin III family protein [Alphaproteobacteria bacterium]